jgi:hypothetical protein
MSSRRSSARRLLCLRSHCPPRDAAPCAPASSVLSRALRTPPCSCGRAPRAHRERFIRQAALQSAAVVSGKVWVASGESGGCEGVAAASSGGRQYGAGGCRHGAWAFGALGGRRVSDKVIPGRIEEVWRSSRARSLARAP